MNNNPNRKTCVLYATATCNLNCKYCYIDKTPILKDIDKILTDSFKDDYYFNFMKEVFNKNSLEEIQVWGGEPSYGLVRTLPTILKAIDYFPNLSRFMFSTNFTTPTCVEDTINFYQAICERAPERQFYFDLQLSLDGPTEINDFNRGQGTTDKFTKNFCKFISKIGDFLDSHKNIYINAFFKPTLDGNNIMNLKTKQDIINYYSFLESYKIIFDKNLISSQIEFQATVPNTATPSPHTQEEGIAFANLCRNIKELYIENPNQFKTYISVMPFAYLSKRPFNNGLCGGYVTCGTGDSVVGLLPNRLISGCHNGFVELMETYKNDNRDSLLENRFFNKPNQNILIFDEEAYASYEKQVAHFYHPDSKFQISEMASLICTIANVGQIDEKYKDYEKAIDAAHFIQERTSSCMRDNILTTGSKYVFASGFIRLFLNGAKEEIEEYGKLFEESRR